METKNQFEELRRIILSDDREENNERNQRLLEKIDVLEKQLNDPDEFVKILHNSKEQVVDMLGPHVGKLIRKFIRSEMERLSENITQKRKAFFSFDFLRKNKKESANGQLAQVFIIHKHSGLVIGEYGNEDTIEPDLIASMLTAIKSFVETAFGDGESDLESLEYGNYTILLFNFEQFYFALITEGILTKEMKSLYFDQCLELADDSIGSLSFKEIDDVLTNKVNKYIQNTFFSTSDNA
ncbi:MAG: hypothetical protein HRT58_20780 [Crocinitomicaceae bacterium]|nr:hypothetical protein [Flavobacteriales bacterium]NQZ38108.1 hypothetical protein [Crocinitomicaceae bacterium]